MESGTNHPSQLLEWLRTDTADAIQADLREFGISNDVERDLRTDRILKGDAFEVLFQINWEDSHRLGRPGDLSLVTISECQDPLCGLNQTGLRLRKVESGLSYLQCSDGDAEGKELAFSQQPLTINELTEVLRSSDWLGSKVALQSLDSCKEEFSVHHILDGEWAVLGIASIYPEIPPQFRCWVEQYCLTNKTT